MCAVAANSEETMFNSWQEWRKGLDQIREQALGRIPEPEPNPKLDDVARQASAYLAMLYTLLAAQVYRLKLLARRVEAGTVSEW